MKLNKRVTPLILALILILSTGSFFIPVKAGTTYTITKKASGVIWWEPFDSMNDTAIHWIKLAGTITVLSTGELKITTPNSPQDLIKTEKTILIPQGSVIIARGKTSGGSAYPVQIGLNSSQSLVCPDTAYSIKSLVILTTGNYIIRLFWSWSYAYDLYLDWILLMKSPLLTIELPAPATVRLYSGLSAVKTVSLPAGYNTIDLSGTYSFFPLTGFDVNISGTVVTYNGLVSGGDYYVVSAVTTGGQTGTYSLSLSTDKTLYNAGDTIQITGTLTFNNTPVQNGKIQLIVNNQTINVLYTDSSGTFSANYSIPNFYLGSQAYVIVAKDLDHNVVATKTVYAISLALPPTNTTTTKRDWSSYLILLYSSGKGYFDTITNTIANMLHIPTQIVMLLLLLVVAGLIISIIMKTWKIIAVILVLAVLLAFLGLI